MPYGWTHIVFGHELLQKTKLPQPASLNEFQLGCQGPDFFFFYLLFPKKACQSARKLGDLFHTQHCGPALIHLIRRAKENPHIRDYVLGFITHHILDRNTHPFIHYKAGYKQYNHQKLEVIIDTLVVYEKKGIKTWENPLAPQIDVGKQLPKDIHAALYQTACLFYPEVTLEPEQYHRAYRDMKRFLSLCFDPYGILLTLTFGFITPFRHTSNVPNQDFLNIQKKEWHHPAIFEETSTTSFWELWDRAMEEGGIILSQVLSFWESNDTTFPEELTCSISNISYDTGKLCEKNLVNHYADPIV